MIALLFAADLSSANNKMKAAHHNDAATNLEVHPSNALKHHVVWRKRVYCVPRDRKKEVVAMRTQGELSFKEIAKIVGAPIGTVLARMHAAKKKLKSLLNTELGR